MNDTFRKTYTTLPSDKNALVLNIKDKAEELEQLMKNVTSREMSLALTNLEQAVMWAVKATYLDNEKIPVENK